METKRAGFFVGERLTGDGERPRFIAVDTLPEDERLIRVHQQWLGGLALRQAVEAPEAGVPSTLALSGLLERARTGDAEAHMAIDANAHLTVIETIFKDGNVTAIRAQRTADGLVQHGHNYRDIHTNALTKVPLSASMQRRTEIEALNCLRMEDYADRGLLKDYWFVVCSLVPDDTPLSQNSNDGFFVDSMTAVFQATTEDAQGVLTESAFVAGVASGQSSEKRHDVGAVRSMLADWGVTGAGQLTSTEMLGKGILIHKSVMQGVTDVVRWYDDKLGTEYFFGDRRPRQNYQTFALECLRRNDRYQSITDAVVEDLLALSQGLDNTAAMQLLYDRAKYHAVKRAFKDHTIDARKAFGAKAAVYIEEGRQLRQSGEYAALERLEQRAQDTAETTACGGSSSANQNSPDNSSVPGGEAANAATATGKASSPESSDSWQWKSGLCRITNCPTRPKITKIGPCSVCWHCQQKFDRGENPVTAYARRRPVKSAPVKAEPTKTKKDYALAA